MIYIFIFAYTIFTAYIVEHSACYRKFKSEISVKKKNIMLIRRNTLKYVALCIIVFLPLVFIHATRYGFGTDYTGTYRKIFYSVLYDNSLNSDSYVELGYVFINKLVASFTSDYVWAIAASSVITYIVLFAAISKNAKYFAQSVMCIFLSGYFLDSTTMMRQIIAISIYIYSIRYVYERSFFKYGICILIGSLFHRSCLFLIPLYFLYGKRYKKRSLLYIIGGTVLGANLIFEAVIYIMGFIPKYAMYIPAMYSDRHFELTYLIVSLVIFLSLFVSNNKNKDDKYYFWLLHSAIAVIITSLSGTISFIFRFLDYFIVTTIILYIPEYLMSIKNKMFRMTLTVATYGVLLLFQIYVLYIVNWYKAIPYKSIWFRM